MKRLVLSFLLIGSAASVYALDEFRVPNLKMVWTADGKTDAPTWLTVQLTHEGKRFKGLVTEASPLPSKQRDADGDPLGYNMDVFDSAHGTLTGIYFDESVVRFTVHYTTYSPPTEGITFEAKPEELLSGHWKLSAAGVVGGVAWSGQSRYTYSFAVLGSSAAALTCEWEPIKSPQLK